MPDPVATPAASPSPPASPNPPPAAASPSGANGGASPPLRAPSAGGGPKPATVADAGLEGDGSLEAPAAFAENWREVMSGGDAKIRGWLDRFGSPLNVAKAALEARRKIGAGEYLKARPDVKEGDPESEAALNEWRAGAGIPKDPAGYLPKDYKVDEAVKADIDGFLGDMHKADADPRTVQLALAWRDKFLQETATKQAERDKASFTKNDDTMRAEWGPDYRGNLTGIRALFDNFGDKALWDKFTQARYPDGMQVGDDPTALRFLEKLSREINPRGTIVPSGGADLGKSIDSELAALRGEMGQKNGSYWTGPLAESKQARYRQLLDIQQKRAARA